MNEHSEGWGGKMLGWIRDRMVERSIPPGISDQTQKWIAEEAAEAAIRQGMVIVGIGGLILFVGLAVALYEFLPRHSLIPGASQPSEGASHVDAGEVRLRLTKEEAESALNHMTIERDKLQGQVADLERRLAEMAQQQSRPVNAAAAPHDSAEGKTLHGKVGHPKRQVAERTLKSQATRPTAAADKGAQIPKPMTVPRGEQVSGEARTAYRCGDGQIVRDPAACEARATAHPEVDPSVPDTYHCGDGRSVPNPADCRTAGSLLPRG